MWLEARTRRAFCYREFVARWRELCSQRGLDPRTGYALETVWEYRLDERGQRRMVRVPATPDPDPELLCDPASPTWWQLPLAWDNAGPSRSRVEAEAILSLAAQSRAATNAPVVRTYPEAPGLISDVFRDWHTERRAQLVERYEQVMLPLREMYAARGEEVITLEGIRLVVPLKNHVA